MQVTFEKLSLDETSLFHLQEFIVPRFTSSFHLHDEFEIILIAKGHGKLYAGNNVTNFSEGELYLFAPGLPHCFYNTRSAEEANELAHAMVIWFKKDFLGTDFFEKKESVLLKSLIKKSENGIRLNNPSQSIIKRILFLNQKKNLERISEILLILNDLSKSKDVIQLSSNNELSRVTLFDSKIINSVFKYIAENFQKEITLDEALSVANMQKSAFCRYFKRKTKKTFTQIVNETRIMHAQKLLAETDKSIFEIAFECGYANTSYFNRQFRLSCKTSPMAFRELLSQSK